MTSFLSSLLGLGSKSSTEAAVKVAMITNFSACPLGLRLLDKLSQHPTQKVIAVSHDASRFEEKKATDSENNVIMFEAFPNE